MDNYQQLSDDYQLIEQAIRYLEANTQRQPELAEVAAQVGLSEFHFQRLFRRWAGISPKRFLQFLTKENAKALLARSSVLSAAFESGLSSPSRLHDLFVQAEAVTPGQYKTKGAGLKISYGFHPSPFGECLLAVTSRGICFLGFVQDGDRAALLGSLRQEWASAELIEDPDLTAPTVERIFSAETAGRIRLHVRGTNFQLKVWEALLRLPAGAVVSYADLARLAGDPRAARAAGNAVAHNPVAYLIPCHRVLRQVGDFGAYRYGSARKKAILARELAGAIDRGAPV